jgi:hypothetical protein
MVKMGWFTKASFSLVVVLLGILASFCYVPIVPRKIVSQMIDLQPLQQPISDLESEEKTVMNAYVLFFFFSG